MAGLAQAAEFPLGTPRPGLWGAWLRRRGQNASIVPAAEPAALQHLTREARPLKQRRSVCLRAFLGARNKRLGT